MKILERIKQKKENKIIFKQMTKLAREHDKKTKTMKKMKDDNEILNAEIELAEIKNKIIELNNSYVYRFRSIDKQKKKEMKKCKSELNDLNLQKELMEKALEKYEKENTDFSKIKYEKLNIKYDRVVGRISKLERRIDMIKGIVQKDVESAMETEEVMEMETDEQKILNGLLKSKERLEEQIRLKEINIEKVQEKASEDLMTTLYKDLEFLKKKKRSIDDNIKLMKESDEKNEEDEN